jgi:two-component system, OmpR family, response regulator
MNQTNVFIIDDEPDICFLLSHGLQKSGFNTHSFHTLKDGYEAVKNDNPHWLILDNNLPDGLGWENIDKFKQAKPQLKIIKISAYDDNLKYDFSTETFQLAKPIKLNDITNIIEGNGR